MNDRNSIICDEANSGLAGKADGKHDAPMITGPQIRAARALLGWSAQELAQRSGVSYPTIQRAESATGVPSMNATNMEKLEVVFNGAGIVFERRNGVLWVGMAPP